MNYKLAEEGKGSTVTLQTVLFMLPGITLEMNCTATSDHSPQQ